MVIGWALLAGTLALVSCSPSPEVGSQTNWLKACDAKTDCGQLGCICGTCTSTCQTNADCTGRGLGACVVSSEGAAVAACDGHTPSAGLCLPRCDDSDSTCPEGAHCVASVCVPLGDAPISVSLDPTQKHQALIGFGAGFGYEEDDLAGRADEDALLDILFVDSGLELVRLRNRFQDDNAAELQITAGLLDGVTARLGHAPQVLLVSGSPPARLKANGAQFCGNSDVACTLSKDAGGAFDYAGLGAYHAAALSAYEGAGIHPDYVAFQNNPNYLPPGAPLEACRYLPKEGTLDVAGSDGSTVSAEFPGYDQALRAVKSAVSAADSYVWNAPESTDPNGVPTFLTPLTAADYGAISFHLYGTDPKAVDEDALAAIAELGASSGLPILQTEMRSAGFDTAALVHYSMVKAGASAYLHHQLVAPAADGDTLSLVSLNTDSFDILDSYHALGHFSRWTRPGWLRIDAQSSAPGLLTSAWLSPDEKSLTVVLLNPGTEALDAELGAEGAAAALLGGAKVYRSTFDGIERMAGLGPLSDAHVVRVPPHSVVTVTTAAK
jgi:O-glycosyl hydrolase